MIKYVPEDTSITFEEIPDEITLCINISNCQNNCKGCHSPYLKQNIGSLLDFTALDELLEKNSGITCLCFMGEGNDSEALKKVILYISEKYPKIKVGLYSGREDVTDCGYYFDFLDYLKIGPFKKEFGPLNKETTNQKLFKKVDGYDMELIGYSWHSGWKDITEKFWKR